MQYPDFTEPFIVTTDASDYALGELLSQGQIGQDLPIAFASRTLPGAELNYSTIEKELLAIMFCVKHFRPYLYGRKFTLVTDHRPLVWLHGLKDPASRLARWRIELSEYEYDIAYKPGRVNSNADSLSWNPCDNGGVGIDSLYVKRNQRFLPKQRWETSKAWSAGNSDTDCDPEEMVESRFVGTGDECGPTVNIYGHERVPMQNGILDTVAQGKKSSHIKWYLMNGTDKEP